MGKVGTLGLYIESSMLNLQTLKWFYHYNSHKLSNVQILEAWNNITNKSIKLNTLIYLFELKRMILFSL